MIFMSFIEDLPNDFIEALPNVSSNSVNTPHIRVIIYTIHARTDSTVSSSS
jgi:hypothetical protein